MDVVIVNGFDTYEDRVELIYRFFKQKNLSVTVVTSDFCHSTKTFRRVVREDFIYLKTKPYTRNMSVARMYSHWDFARKAAAELEKLNPRFIYVLAPPNSLVKEIAGYKERRLGRHRGEEPRTAEPPRTTEPSGVKLVLDLIDLWPETMPIRRFKDNFFFKKWAQLRNGYLGAADYIVTECDLYRVVLKEYLKDHIARDKTRTVYLARRSGEASCCSGREINDKISLCYLGSINHIIDIDVIGRIIQKISTGQCTENAAGSAEIPTATAVELHIVGGGEQKEELLRVARENGATVIDHGRVYDPAAKQAIFAQCDYGLNIMKPYVCVGLTMKSIDYFEAGLPIINNIKGDTWEFVKQWGIGVNYAEDQPLRLPKTEKQVVREFFENTFSEEVFYAQMECVYEAVRDV